MNVSAQQTYVSQLLGDTGNVKWTIADFILPALNTSQFEFVQKLLAYGAGDENIYDMLTNLQDSTTQSVDTVGYDLDGLVATKRIIPGGYIASKCTVDSVTRWVTRISMSNLPQQNNRYLKGSDERPVCYIYQNTYFLIVTAGSYPLSATIYFIREPKELVASGAIGYQVATCEVSTIFHRLICKMAAAECHRMVGDQVNLTKYQAIMGEVDREVQAIATHGRVEPKAEDIESWRKK